MVGCEQCEREAVSLGPPSAGSVQDEEIICRGHYQMPDKRPGRPLRKLSIIKETDLLNGELSVWRASRLCNSTVDDAVGILHQHGPTGGSLWKVYGITANRLRTLDLSEINLNRAFCVLDDTRCDDQGGRHALHAVIAICRLVGQAIDAVDDPIFQQIKTILRREFEISEVWSAAV